MQKPELIARLRVVTLMVLFSILSYFDRTIMSVTGPDIIRDFHLSETEMGIIYSAFIFGYALAMIPGGYLADQIGPSRTLTAMGFGAALFTGLTALGTKPGLGSILGVLTALAIIRFLMGVCTAPLYPACGRMNANWFSVEKQGLVWGLVAAGAGIGSALSPSLFAWMIPRYGWRASFLIAGSATAIVAVVWVRTVTDSPSPRRCRLNGRDPKYPVTLRFKDFGEILRNRNVLLLSIGYLTVGYFEYIFFFWIYYYFGKIRGMTPGETSTYTTIIFLAWVVMTPLGGWVSDYLIKTVGKPRGRPIVPIAGMVASAVLLIIATQLSGAFAVGAALAVALGMASSTDGPFWSATIEAGGKDVGAACGILNTGSNIGGFIAPVLTPMIASVAGWSGALYFACLVIAGGSLVWVLLVPPVLPTTDLC